NRRPVTTASIHGRELKPSLQDGDLTGLLRLASISTGAHMRRGFRKTWNFSASTMSTRMMLISAISSVRFSLPYGSQPGGKGNANVSTPKEGFTFRKLHITQFCSRSDHFVN